MQLVMTRYNDLDRPGEYLARLIENLPTAQVIDKAQLSASLTTYRLTSTTCTRASEKVTSPSSFVSITRNGMSRKKVSAWCENRMWSRACCAAGAVSGLP